MSITAMKQALEALEDPIAFAKGRAAITALRSAIEQAEKQEPVAWANINKHGDITHTNNKRMPWSKTPLYITPPAAQRQWVGLEPSDMPDGDDPMYDHDFFLKGMVWADAILRKKNATPPAAQRQPLTDDQIDDIWNRYCDEMGEASINDAYDIARAIEAAHGIGEKT